jgi:hypothetical protein
LLSCLDASIPFLVFIRKEMITSNSCAAKFFMMQKHEGEDGEKIGINDL